MSLEVGYFSCIRPSLFQQASSAHFCLHYSTFPHIASFNFFLLGAVPYWIVFCFILLPFIFNSTCTSCNLWFVLISVSLLFVVYLYVMDTQVSKNCQWDSGKIALCLAGRQWLVDMLMQRQSSIQMQNILSISCSTVYYIYPNITWPFISHGPCSVFSI
jgi:hypothetical protein